MPDGEGSNARRQAAGIWCEVLPFDEISSRKKKLLMVEVRNYGERRQARVGEVLPFDENASPKQDSSDNRKGGRVSGCLARRFQKKVSARYACEDQKGKCTVN